MSMESELDGAPCAVSDCFEPAVLLATADFVAGVPLVITVPLCGAHADDVRARNRQDVLAGTA